MVIYGGKRPIDFLTLCNSLTDFWVSRQLHLPKPRLFFPVFCRGTCRERPKLPFSTTPPGTTSGKFFLDNSTCKILASRKSKKKVGGGPRVHRYSIYRGKDGFWKNDSVKFESIFLAVPGGSPGKPGGLFLRGFRRGSCRETKSFELKL